MPFTFTPDAAEESGFRFIPDEESSAPESKEESEPAGSGYLRRFLGDPALSLLKGAIRLPEAAVGILDIPTGGGVGKFLEAGGYGFQPKAAREAIDTWFSPEQQAANQQVQAAEGFIPTIKAAASNPSTIAHTVLESVPSLLGGATVARGLLSAAPRLGALAAGAVGEGVVGAGISAEETRQSTESGLLTPEQSALAATSGAVTGLISVLGGRLAKKLGIADIDTALAGATSPAAKSARFSDMVKSAAAEGILEELPQSAQERIAQNVAQGKPWNEGVAGESAMGMVAGGLAGGAAPLIPSTRPSVPPKAAELFSRTESVLPRSTEAARAVVEKPVEVAPEVIAETPIAEVPKVTEAAVAEVPLAERVGAMSPPEFFEAAKTGDLKGGLTETAFELGKTVKTPEELARLRELESQAQAQAREAIARSDVDALQGFGMKKQFFTEAIEQALGVAEKKTTMSREAYEAAMKGELPSPAIENLSLLSESNLGRASAEGKVPTMLLPDGTALIGESHPTIIAKYETLNPGASTEGAISGFTSADGTFTSSPGWPEATSPIKRVQRPQADLRGPVPTEARDIQTVESEFRGLKSLTDRVTRTPEFEHYFQRLDELEAELGRATPISETIGGKAGEQSKTETSQPGVTPPADSAPLAETVNLNNRDSINGWWAKVKKAIESKDEAAAAKLVGELPAIKSAPEFQGTLFALTSPSRIGSTFIDKLPTADGSPLWKWRNELQSKEKGGVANEKVQGQVQKEAQEILAAESGQRSPPQETAPSLTTIEEATTATPVAGSTPKAISALADRSETLGVMRPSVADTALRQLSEGDFDKAYNAARDRVDRLEQQMDEGTLTKSQRTELGRAQDKWSSVELERYRRNLLDTIPADLFRELLKRTDDPPRAQIVLDEMQRQGVSREQAMAEIKLRSPDEAEVFRGKLEQLKNLATSDATPAKGSSQSLGIVPPGTQQLQSIIDAAIAKPQGVDSPVRTDVMTPLPDFQPHANSKKIFSQPFGFERLPVLGALWGGLRRLKGNVNEAITAYHGERNVGRAVASALAQEYSWLKKPFTVKDGQIENIGAAEGQSRYISDVFEALQRDPEAYQLTPEQRAAFDAMQKLEGDFKKLEQKYGLSKAIEEEGGVGTEGGEGRAYFPRVVVEAPEGRGSTLGTGAKVGGKAFFEKSRLFETEAEGWQKGWKYEEDITRRIATRAERLYKRIADKRLADDPTLDGLSRKELDAQLKDGYAEELASGEMTPAKLQQIGDSIEQQGRVWQPQFFNKIFPRETAEAMNKAFPQTQSGLRSMAANVNNALNGLWLGFDLGAGFIQGQGTMFYQPKVWAKAQVNSLRSMVSPEFFPEYVRQNLEPIREMAQLGSSVGRMEEMLAGAERGELLQRIPGVKQTLGRAIQPFARQFQTFIDTAKVELWKGLRDTTPQAEWPRVMQSIESVLSTSRMEPVGIGAGRALSERALLIAPSYYRGALNLVAGMGEKGVSGQVARRAMGAYMAGGALLFYGVGKALGMSDEDLQKRFDPRRSDFMLWRVKTGERTTEIGFGGIFKSLMKLGGNIVKTSIENPENWKSLSPEKNPITRWYRGHAGPAVGLVWDQFSGRDFMGQEANLGDLSKVPLPMVARTAMTEGQRFSPLDTAATFAGLTAFERTNPSSQEINKLASAYRKKAGLPDTADFVTTETPARRVREALQQRDTKAAMAALQELRKTKKDPDIFKGFQQSRTRAFTGSAEREGKFKASLTPQQRALYDAAKAEKERDYQAFLDLWRNKPSRP